MQNIDLVYPVKVLDDLGELRYSLRSVWENARGLYDKIWIITQEELPSWLQNVNVIKAGAGGNKANDVKSKILAACEHPEVSDNFIMMCDDFYLVDKIDQWETFHMGPTSLYIKKIRSERAGNNWLRSVSDTAEWMRQQGYGDIPVYQGHRPVLWDKEKLKVEIERYPSNKQLDTNGLYPAAGAGGEGTRGMNSKIKDNKEFLQKFEARNIPWLSSNNGSFSDGMIGGYIRGAFRNPSPYEA